jgi:hypothetical protein
VDPQPDPLFAVSGVGLGAALLGVTVSAEEIVAWLVGGGGMAALGYGAKWLYDKWQAWRKLKRGEQLEDHQRTRAERAEDENVMIAHLREINARHVEDREANRKEVHDLRNEMDALVRDREKDRIELATQKVMINRLRDWVRVLERTLDDRKIPHLKWSDVEPSGSEIHAALQQAENGGK